MSNWQSAVEGDSGLIQFIVPLGSITIIILLSLDTSEVQREQRGCECKEEK